VTIFRLSSFVTDFYCAWVACTPRNGRRCQLGKRGTKYFHNNVLCDVQSVYVRTNRTDVYIINTSAASPRITYITVCTVRHVMSALLSSRSVSFFLSLLSLSLSLSFYVSKKKTWITRKTMRVNTPQTAPPSLRAPNRTLIAARRSRRPTCTARRKHTRTRTRPNVGKHTIRVFTDDFVGLANKPSLHYYIIIINL